MKKLKSIHGFTLIEILVAMAIISIVSTGFYTMINSSIKHNVKNEKDIQSLNMAQSEIENLRSQIKSSSDNLKIYINGNDIIEIPNDDNIMWREIDSLNEIDNIKINPDGIYNKYMLDSDDSVIKYYKSLDSNNTEYEINLKLSRQKKSRKYLYNVKISVWEKDKKFTKKVTTLETNVLSK